MSPTIQTNGTVPQVSCEEGEEYKRNYRLQLKALAEAEGRPGVAPELLFVYLRPPSADPLARGPAKVGSPLLGHWVSGQGLMRGPAVSRPGALLILQSVQAGGIAPAGAGCRVLSGATAARSKSGAVPLRPLHSVLGQQSQRSSSSLSWRGRMSYVARSS